MIILADALQTLLDLSPVPLPAAVAPEATPVAALTPAERRLWSAAGRGGRPLRVEVAAPAPLAFWSHAVLVGEAERSQYDALRGLGDLVGDLGGGVACLAGHGRGFHGHRGRTWQAVRGNLHLSAACAPGLDARACGLALTALPAVATIESLLAVARWRERPALKWVNDVIASGRKVAGVLTATQSARGRVTALVVGVGLNVARAPAVPPGLFVPAVGALPELVQPPAPPLPQCLAALLERLAGWIRRTGVDGPAPLLDAYRRHSLVVGREVLVWEEGLPEDATREALPEPVRRGRVIGIDDDLALRLEGQAEPVRRGRLVLVATGERDAAGPAPDESHA
ncbi:MAG: hypothetical protein R6X25_10100 [Candidatus Krumholzibacteriia bacterium]